MLGVVGVAFIASGDRVTRLLGFAVPIYFIVMTSLHHEVHTVVVSELQLQEQNDEANVQLREANAQLSRQALRDDLTGLANRPAFMARSTPRWPPRVATRRRSACCISTSTGSRSSTTRSATRSATWSSSRPRVGS